MAAKVGEFLKFAACATKLHSECICASISIVGRIYTKLFYSGSRNISRSDEFYGSAAPKLNQKVHTYEPYLKTLLTHFARVINSRFYNDICNDATVLRQFVCTADCNIGSSSKSKNIDLGEKSFLMNKILDENSLSYSEDDETIRFLRATSNADCSTNALDSSSAASETAFFTTDTLIEDHRSTLSNDIVRACMRFHSRKKILN